MLYTVNKVTLAASKGYFIYSVVLRENMDIC